MTNLHHFDHVNELNIYRESLRQLVSEAGRAVV